MPFTLSHPALVLPITYMPKRFYSLTGLFVGSMVPDFEYFLRMNVNSIYSHKWLGILWFDLPLALMLTFIYHYTVRDSLINNLPKAAFIRISQFNKFSWYEYFKAKWLIVIISIIIGSFSHVFWDSFTHVTGYFVLKFHPLRHSLLFFGKNIYVYDLLQHISTIVGGVFVMLFIYQLPKNDSIKQNKSNSYWILVIFIIFAIVIFRLSAGLHYKVYGTLIINIISAGLIALVATPVCFKIKNRFKHLTVK
jgi:hypothetical protein